MASMHRRYATWTDVNLQGSSGPQDVCSRVRRWRPHSMDCAEPTAASSPHGALPGDSTIISLPKPPHQERLLAVGSTAGHSWRTDPPWCPRRAPGVRKSPCGGRGCVSTPQSRLDKASWASALFEPWSALPRRGSRSRQPQTVLGRYSDADSENVRHTRAGVASHKLGRNDRQLRKR